MEQQEKQVEINLIDLFYYLKKKIVIIAAVTVIFAIAGFLYSSLFMTPMYTAETRMYVLNRSSASGPVSSDFQISNNILEDYKILITGKNVTKEVVEQLGLSMSPAALGAKIRVTAPENTRVLQITVTDTNPERAADITNKVAEVATEQMQQIMDVEAARLIYAAEVPGGPSGPNVKRNSVLAAMLGMVATVIVLVLIHLLDDTIRTEEDVERYLGLSVLGVIPDTNDINTAAENSAAKKKPLIRIHRKTRKK